MNLKILKVMSIVIPAFLVGLLELLRHALLDEQGLMLVGDVAIVVMVLIGAFFLSTFVFGIIERTQRESLHRNQELTALNSVVVAVNESLNMDVVLYRALNEVVKVTAAQAGEIFLLDEKNKILVRQIFAGALPEDFRENNKLRIGKGLAGKVVQTGEPIIVQDLLQEAELYKNMFKRGGFRSMISVPIKSKNANIGAFNIISTDPGRFAVDDSRLLTTIGHQIGVAIENARLLERVQSIAAVEERERLAREMHDGLAQVLTYVIIKSQAARQYIALGQGAEAKSHLMDLEKAAEEIYADVREVILGLRSTTSPQRDILSTLREFVFRFSQMNGIRTELEVSNGKITALPASRELQVIRIIQEALSNIRKHAGASHAWVRISERADKIEVTIQDDGHGFDISSVSQEGGPHFGIQIMKERAESIRSKLDVTSASGQGTTVTLIVPITQKAIA